MTFYKGADFVETLDFKAIENMTNFPEINDESSADDSENDEINLDEIEEHFQILKAGILNDEMNHTIQYLSEIIQKYPQQCFDFVDPLHFERAVSFLNEKCFQKAEIIHLVHVFFNSYSHVLRLPEIIQFYPTFFDSFSDVLSQTDLNDKIGYDFFDIITSLIYDDDSLNYFTESKIFKELLEQINNKKMNFLFALKLSHYITLYRVPSQFFELTERFMDISIDENEESLFALKIILNLAKIDAEKIARYVIDYNAPESCYLEDLCLFLRENPDKCIVALQLLSQLTQAEEIIFDSLRKYNILFEVKNIIQFVNQNMHENKGNGLEIDKNNQIVIEALNFYLSWLNNSGSFCFYLFDSICHFDIAEMCENLSYQVKKTMMKVLLYLSQKAQPIQLHSLLKDALLCMLAADLDEAQNEVCKNTLSFFQYVIQRCSGDNELLSRIQEVISDIAFDNSELKESYAQLEFSLNSVLIG